MKPSEQKRALASAVKAAHAAGQLMRQNLQVAKKVNEVTLHDIKLELDVRCQKLIERILLASFPKISVVGEEGSSGDPNSEQRWVIDPIDGTVNFTYGIPHACVSIALQTKSDECRVTGDGNRSRERTRLRVTRHTPHVTLLGVVYDPFQDELWTAIRGKPARLNGQIIRVSKRRELGETVVVTGFSKTAETLSEALPYFNKLVHRVRKVRIMGSAALALTYVATGRFDAYIEKGISLWDIAAGGLIIECAGGEFWRKPIPGEHKFQMIASNGLLRKKLASFGRFKGGK